MKALIATGKGNAEFVDVPKPEPNERQILAKVRYAGICATDIAIITDNTSFVEKGLIEYPVRLGHEWSGVVTEVGSKVTNLKPGDHVVSETGAYCYECPECLSGGVCRNARAVGTVGHHWPGCFAEYMLMPAPGVYKISDGLDMKNAALFEPATIAMKGIQALSLQPGDTVLVIGTGPIGLTGVGILKAMGMRVIVSGRRDGKLEYAKKMGADLTVNINKTLLKQFLLAHTERGYVNAIVETSGSPDVVNECATLIKYGRAVMLGFLEKKLDGFDLDSFVLSGNSIMSPIGGPGALKKVIKLAEQESVDFSPLVTGVYPFAQALKAIEKVIENGDGRIKILLDFGE